MRIGIIAAMNKEISDFIEKMTIEKIHKVSAFDFLECKFKNNKLIIVISGIGKVSAGIATQLIISEFNVEFIINIGVAGTLSEEIGIFDIVLSNKSVQHDFDTTAVGDDFGFITGINKIFFNSFDFDLINKIDLINNEYKKNLVMSGFLCELSQSIKQKVLSSKITSGIVATGDQFVFQKSRKTFIKQQFCAKCCEMELGAIMQVAEMNKAKTIGIKMMSDNVENLANVEYFEFLEYAKVLLPNLLISFLDTLG